MHKSRIRMKIASITDIAFIMMVSFAICPKVQTAELPEVKVISVERVFYNGEHNAFTDLCQFNGRLYLTFRSCPDGHSVFPSSSIIVLSSQDGKKWQQVHQFSVVNRDVRDPHFLIYQEKLFVYTGTWYCPSRTPIMQDRELNKHLGYCAWTMDGTSWNGPEMLEGTYGHYIWRAAAYNGKAYLCGRRKHEFAEMPRDEESRRITESAMLVSKDGIVWKKAALFQEYYGDETAFLFEPDGGVLAVCRRGSENAELCRSNPPYAVWERKDLAHYVGGPLLVKWKDHYLVGGRKQVGDSRTTALYWLHNDQLIECAELPSGGDNSYPGFVEISSDRALISYYSSHEMDEQGKPMTAIYVALIEKTK